MTPREALEVLRPFNYGDPPTTGHEAYKVLERLIEQHEAAMALTREHEELAARTGKLARIHPKFLREALTEGNP